MRGERGKASIREDPPDGVFVIAHKAVGWGWDIAVRGLIWHHGVRG